MRLIDADKLIKICRKGWKLFGREDEKLKHWVDEDDIRNQPTIKAIPIEWIEKKVQEFLMNRNFRLATDFQEVIDMWKVENNIPLFDGELKITLEKENETN